jgi:transmembrane sensor
MENYIKLLYKKFLHGNIRKDEFLEMRHELNKSDSKELINLLSEDWNEGVHEMTMDSTDKEKIRSKINFYMESESRYSRRKQYLGYAAVLIPLFIIASVLLIMQKSENSPQDFVVTVGKGDRAQITLPDQTKVWMNSNSQLEYSTSDKKIRNVKLVGEAYFKVSHNKERPFIVSVNNLKVEVLGTAFNVKAREGNSLVETTLVEGSVRLSGNALSQDYLLKPNQKAVYNDEINQVEISPADVEVATAWINNKIKINSERLADVLNRLEEWYGVNIILKNTGIENDKITGTFKGDDLKIVLEALCIQYNLQYTMQGDSLFILHN